MPDRFEPGTPNLPGIVGLHASLTWLAQQGTASIYEHEMNLTRRFLEGLRPLQAEGKLKLIGKPTESGRTGVVSIQTLTKELSQAAFELDDQFGLMTRVGLHCAPSAHMTLGTYPTGTIRFSFGWWNTEAHVDRALDALTAIL